MFDIIVLCLDDDKHIVENIKNFLATDYHCIICMNHQEALNHLGSRSIDFLIMNYQMHGAGKFKLLKEARTLQADKGGIHLVVYTDRELLCEIEYSRLADIIIEKPLKYAALKSVLDSAALRFSQKQADQERFIDIPGMPDKEYESEISFIGKNGDLAQIWKQLEQTAPTDENVLVTGETGTGKDVVARMIHSMSRRRENPFIKINCGAIPATLIESELFGHERGAFSGADHRKTGKIELAHNGTLFLDEIGELPLELQSSLLHVVEEKYIERIGGTLQIPVDFRLVSATNKSIEQLSGYEFRQDLFYRISTVHIALPELKDRPNDLPEHILSLVRKNCMLFNKPDLDINSKAIDLLCSYNWPGNIRELDNELKRVILMKPIECKILTPSDFLHLTEVNKCMTGSFTSAVTQISREMIICGTSMQNLETAVLQKLMELCGGSVMEASRKTGISKDRFYRLFKK